MLLTKIVSAVNKLVGNNSSIPLTYNKLEFYINSAVDYINLFLNTEMHTPSEDWQVNQITYNIIYSDKYLGEYAFTEEDMINGVWQTYPELRDAESGKIFYNTSLDLYYKSFLQDENTIWLKQNVSDFYNLENLRLETTLKYNYTCLPEKVIRQVLVYYIAALYLEEEDEFETQYKTYKTRAEDALEKIRKIHYSVYDVEW